MEWLAETPPRQVTQPGPTGLTPQMKRLRVGDVPMKEPMTPCAAGQTAAAAPVVVVPHHQGRAGRLAAALPLVAQEQEQALGLEGKAWEGTLLETSEKKPLSEAVHTCCACQRNAARKEPYK